MKLVSLKAHHYRSLRDETIEFKDLNLFIGPNASGKSTILDALRFLSWGVQEHDFKKFVLSRGGFLNLAWRGDEVTEIRIVAELKEKQTLYEWSVQLSGNAYGFSIDEQLVEHSESTSSVVQLLEARAGQGW